ncbi:related to Uracil-DNA glycosylase, mitochondrial [Saccharomycodes ludwigii]|uniref:Uracil-DNA glycosylase n=1 Tax=Saccharomycodes ludwigii TaxID=36035 RepID=A0A376B710_9ASCO|nr:related to Uracil-DNA glycosylase, mitochondrial [Saccharomycodes ludwigii]
MTAQNKRPKTVLDFFTKKEPQQQFKKQKTNLSNSYKKENHSVLSDPNGKENLSIPHNSSITNPTIVTSNESLIPSDKQALLKLEIDTIDPSWFKILRKEFIKPYFLSLKTFLNNEINVKHKKVFPPEQDIYSWTRLTKFEDVKVVIIGQDPYHNFNQAHGLAFSVRHPTPAPPSLINIYKEIQKYNYPDFKIDNSNGDLTNWSKQGVLLLNTCLTVEAHKAFSHAKKGWEIFTSKVIELLILDRLENKKPLCLILWGNNAKKVISKDLAKKIENKKNILVLKSTHPSPLSAGRGGFFNERHFKKVNDWLFNDFHQKMIDWSIVEGTTLKEVQEKNQKLIQ